MRPIVVTVGPLATADADGISTSQRHSEAYGFAINGALSSGFDADAIATAQAVAGAGNLTLDGVLVSGGVARLGDMPGKYVTITSSGNDSSVTFTVKGLNYGPNGQYYQSEIIIGSNASIVASTKRFYQVTAVTASGAAAGTVSIGVNGTWTADEPRQVLITSAGNDSGLTFTFTGTDWNGLPITEAVTGPNATTAATLYSYATLSSITTSNATASTVTLGTNGVAYSRPINLDNWAFAPTGGQVTVSGSANFTVQQSLDDPERTTYAGVTWLNHPDSAVVAATATAQFNYAYLPQIARIVLNSGSGSVTMTLNQSGNAPL